MHSKTKSPNLNPKKNSQVFLNLLMILALTLGLLAIQAPQPASAATLLSANFNSTTDGFTYQDDAFGTSQPSYASGARSTTGGYGGTGGLQVSLGGVDANAINGMSGGWSYPLSLAAAESGVKLSFRYKLEQTAAYEFDEFSRVLVKFDGMQYGRGSKNYVDHIGGDGSSTQGNSSTFLPTTDWQQVEIFLGDLASGSHTLILGGYNNKKDASDESTTLVIDDVSLTSANPTPAASDVKTLVNRLSISQFLAYNQGIAVFNDRCRMTGCSSTDYTNAQNWVMQQLTNMGYSPQKVNFTYSGFNGSNVWATKVGTVHPEQMYIISAHLDGRSGGDAYDDDGSGVALLLEMARVLSSPDVTTDISIRFAFWDNEESGLYGAYGYVQDRRSLQGQENPAGSGLYPEPTWLGVIQHDMILYDHGAGTRTTAQSAYADLDVEWRAGTTKETDSKALALKWRFLNGEFSTDYPATAYNYSTNTDDTAFHPYVASVSVRENRRSLTSGGNAEWINPYYHTTSDVEASYTRDDDGDGKRDDTELGFNAVQATFGTAATLAGAHIASANNPPTANPQSVTTNEDTSKPITLTGSDPDGNPLTFSLVSNPSHGSLSGSAPNLTYTPSANYTGADSFSFKVNDGTVDSTPATVSITVTAVNDVPVANPQSVTTNEDTPKVITLSGSDIESSVLTYTVVANPAHGSLSGTAPNLTYTPTANYFGADSFTFKVNDGALDSAPAAVTITVNAVNDAPVSNSQAVTTDEDTPKAITLSGSDIEAGALSYAVINSPAHGSLSGSAPNLTYTPAANYNGADSFTFKVNDGLVDSAPATVGITINAVNDAPEANDQSVLTSQDVPVGVTLTGTDIDGDALTYNVIDSPAHGALSGVAPDLVYTPESGYQGPDSFTFAASDGQLSSTPGTVSITVTHTNHQPTADAQSVTTAEDTPLAVTLTGADPDSDPLAFLVIDMPVHGSLSGVAPDLTYTPAANYNGVDSFTFKINDGLVDSLPATVSIDVAPVNDMPVANQQSATLAEDGSVAVTLTASDVDGDPLTYSIVGSPVHGALSGAAPDLTYTPAANYFGSDSFTFTVNDGTVDSAPAAVSLAITSVNDLPLADPQSLATAEDTALAITLTGSDLETGMLTYSVVSAPTHGSLSGIAPNLTYTPAANYNGPDSFTFKVNDGVVDSVPAAVGITVSPVNDAPLANPQSLSTLQDTALAITLTGSDVEGDALTFTVNGGPANGSLSGTAPDLTYTPNPGFTGADSFTFVASDGQAFSNPAAVNITVNANGPYLYIGSTTSGTAGSVSYADEDILVKNLSTGVWSLYFDGSDVGLSSVDVDAFELQPDGSLLMSFDADFSLSGFAAVDESDILRFVPTSLGNTTAGTWQWYFDGSDVGLTTSDEDVDALTVLPDGRLVVSTLGAVSVTNASGQDEDLLAFTPSQLGSTTSGSWVLYFDGSDVGLSSTSNEDVNGVWQDAAGKVYLTTIGSFSVTGLSGDGSDIFVCTPGSLGSTTTCTYSMYWDGSVNGFSGEDTDSFSIVP